MTMTSRISPAIRRSLSTIGLCGAALLAVLGLSGGARAAIGPAAHAPLRLSGVGSRALGLGLGLEQPQAHAASSNAPLGPGQIRAAYSLPAHGAHGQKIAVVSTYDDPHIESDLNAYDSYFGLAACTRANGCFTKLNELGQPSPLPIADPSGGEWITESSIGVEVARGICQSCSVMLIEANAGYDGDIARAIGVAAKLGATVVVTAVTPAENTLDSDWASTIDNAHAAVVAAAGDAPSGYGYGGLDFPASLPNVLSVGGTNLQRTNDGHYRGESVWSPTVSGCSTFNKAGSWQRADARKVGCGSFRAVADLAAMSMPGALVHITGVSSPGGPWYAASGTSLSAPIIAAAIGLAGSAGNGEAKLVYQQAQRNPGALHDVTSGENSPRCTKPGCKAGRGYDGPTGLGTPDGLGLFKTATGSLSPKSPKLDVSAPNGHLQVSAAWNTHLTLHNGNHFPVSGKLVVRQRLRVGGRMRVVVFASAPFNVGALGTSGPSLTISSRERNLLSRLHRVSVDVQLQARGTSGGVVTVTRKLLLLAPVAGRAGTGG
jgi:Subtilase family